MKNRTSLAEPTAGLGGRDPSPQRRWWITPLALLLIGCLWFALRPSPDQTMQTVVGKVIGKPMPEIRLGGLTGSDRAICSEDLAGSVVLINFWATWCGPCRIELPHLAKLEKKFSSREDFLFLSVSVGPAESADQLAALRQETLDFLAGIDLDIPTYADPGNATIDRFYDLAFDVELPSGGAVPTTIVLDRQGIIRGVWIGYGPGVEDQVEEAVSQSLDGNGK